MHSNSRGCFRQYIDADRDIRNCISRNISLSPKSRQQIADEMSSALGIGITTNMLNGFSANSKSMARFPVVFANAFCEVVGDDSLQRLLLSPRLLRLLEWAEMNLDVAVNLKKIEAARLQLLSDLEKANKSRQV